MANVRLVSASLVQAPTIEEPTNQKIELSSCDLKLLLVGSIQKGLLFPKPNSKLESLIQHLKSSLSQTLKFFYPLAGRLATLRYEDYTVSYFIDCNNAGAQFVHAVAKSVAISDVLQPICIPPIVQSFFPLTEFKNYEGVSNPLLGIQINELSDGIFIGCTMNHVVADGSTFWNFIKSWSEISRGLNHISKPPIFMNWLRNFSIKLPVSILDFSGDISPSLLEDRVFHFSKENIVHLKARANFEAGVENVVISSLQSVLAHLWRALVRNREMEPEKLTKMVFVIGYRRRLNPEIPDEYFGNAIHGVRIELKARQLLEKGLGFVALQLNKLVSDYTLERARNDINTWVKDPKVSTFSRIISDSLLTSSSPRFNVYGNDFGWGKPIAVRSGPGNKFDGKITLFPGLEQGSIDIEVCLSPPVLHSLGNDSEFMDVVTV